MRYPTRSTIFPYQLPLLRIEQYILLYILLRLARFSTCKMRLISKNLSTIISTLTIYTIDKYYIARKVRRRGNESQPILEPRSPIIRVLELLGGEAAATLQNESFDRVSVESRAKRFHESISIVISGTGGVKSEREEPIGSTSTSTSSSSSSSFSFTVQCPRLTFRARYTFRTRKPRRVRLQTEFACKTRSFIVRGTILTSLSFQYRALWNVIVANSACMKSWRLRMRSFDRDGGQ